MFARCLIKILQEKFNGKILIKEKKYNMYFTSPGEYHALVV